MAERILPAIAPPQFKTNTFAWDRSPSESTGPIVYTLHWGPTSGDYTNSLLAGSNATITAVTPATRMYYSVGATWQGRPQDGTAFSTELIWPPIPKTNRVITVSVLRSTNSSPFVLYSSPLAKTNPLGTLFYRTRTTLSTNSLKQRVETVRLLSSPVVSSGWTNALVIGQFTNPPAQAWRLMVTATNF